MSCEVRWQKNPAADAAGWLGLPLAHAGWKLVDGNDSDSSTDEVCLWGSAGVISCDFPRTVSERLFATHLRRIHLVISSSAGRLLKTRDSLDGDAHKETW